ncbi:MAG: HEAT repeat domain-containing protein [Planctomycetota bacterium]
MKINPLVLFALCLLMVSPLTTDSAGDELFIASGRKLSPAQRDYIQDRVKWLRDSDYSRRFEAIQFLIRLDLTALPFLTEVVERDSNPTPVRCAILALSEINKPEIAPLISRVVSDHRSSDDELIIAALGLGKLDVNVDLDLLRQLIQPDKNRQVRKAAALALTRKRDGESASTLINLAKAEREDELASLFLLSAAMIGGEEVIKAMPRLFKSADLDRRRALILGAAFLGDPVLLPTLLKFSRNDKHMADLLSVSLGRFPSPEVATYLMRVVSGPNPDLAIDALYASLIQADEDAWNSIECALNPARPSQVRAHALLAMIERECTQRFLQLIFQSMKDPHPEVRSAAVLALLKTGHAEAPTRLIEALRVETQPSVVHDLLLTLGLTGGVQTMEPIERWTRPSLRENAAAWELESTAETVISVFEGKTDPALLREQYEERLKQLSMGWGARFRVRVMNEIFKWMGLDRIIRKAPENDGTGSGQIGSDTPQSGTSEDTDASGEGEAPNSGEPEGTGTGEETQVSSQTTSADDTSTDPAEKQKKFLFRREVVEWDLLMWFTHYSYFPDECFAIPR